MSGFNQKEGFYWLRNKDINTNLTIGEFRFKLWWLPGSQVGYTDAELWKIRDFVGPVEDYQNGDT